MKRMPLIIGIALYVALLVFLGITITSAQKWGVGRFVIKNAKIRTVSTPPAKVNISEELLKIDTVTGKVWGLGSVVFIHKDGTTTSVSRWQELGVGVMEMELDPEKLKEELKPKVKKKKR